MASDERKVEYTDVSDNNDIADVVGVRYFCLKRDVLSGCHEGRWGWLWQIPSGRDSLYITSRFVRRSHIRRSYEEC